MLRPLRIAVALLLIACVGLSWNSGSGTPPSPAEAAHGRTLPTLGPVQLIMTNYTHSIVASCDFESGDFTLEWEFDADDIPGVPAGGDITDADSDDADVEEDGPTVELEFEGTGGCNSTAARDFVGTVTGELSNGDTFTITLLGS